MIIEKDICKKIVFDEIFRAHSSNLFNFLYYKYGATNNPQDIVQEAFLKLWENCRKVVPEKAKSFLFTVANNQMLNVISRKKTVLTYESHTSDYTIESPEFLMEENEYMARLQKAIEELTEDQRVTFLLNRIEGKKHKEIAELLGISRKTVEKRIYTVLKILRKKVGNI